MTQNGFPSFVTICDAGKLILISPQLVASHKRCGQMWQNFKIIWHFFGFIYHSANSELNLANFVCFWAYFYCCKWPDSEKTILLSGHTLHIVNAD